MSAPPSKPLLPSRTATTSVLDLNIRSVNHTTWRSDTIDGKIRASIPVNLEAPTGFPAFVPVTIHIQTKTQSHNLITEFTATAATSRVETVLHNPLYFAGNYLRRGLQYEREKPYQPEIPINPRVTRETHTTREELTSHQALSLTVSLSRISLSHSPDLTFSLGATHLPSAKLHHGSSALPSTLPCRSLSLCRAPPESSRRSLSPTAHSLLSGSRLGEEDDTLLLLTGPLSEPPTTTERTTAPALSRRIGAVTCWRRTTTSRLDSSFFTKLLLLLFL